MLLVPVRRRARIEGTGSHPRPAPRRSFQDAFDKGYLDATPCPQGQFLDLTHGSIPEDLICTYFRSVEERCKGQLVPCKAHIPE